MRKSFARLTAAFLLFAAASGTVASCASQDAIISVKSKASGVEIIYKLNESSAAKDLYAQLPMTVDVEPFSDNEIIFYPPKKLNTASSPLTNGASGVLAYYEPWGDAVMFHAPHEPNGALFELGSVVSGEEHIKTLSGAVTVSRVSD